MEAIREYNAGMTCCTSPPLHTLVWLIALPLLVASCASSRTGLDALSLGEEWRLGRQLEAKTGFARIDDPAAQAYVVAQGERLLAGARADFAAAALTWEFQLVEDAPFLAAALPGGVIVVTRRLAVEALDYGEFMAFLAVQIGHALDRHAAAAIMETLDQRTLRAMLAGDQPALLDSLAADLAGSATLLDYEGDAQRDADRVAIALLYKAGIDPMVLVTGLEHVRAEVASGGAVWSTLAQRHPVDDERIQRARSYVRSLPHKELTRDDPGYDPFRARLGWEAPHDQP